MIWPTKPDIGILVYTIPALASLGLAASPLLRARPSAGDVDPFGHTAAFLAFYVDDIGIAATSAAHAILLWRVPMLPVIVLLESLALVHCRLLEVRLPRQLPSERRVGRAMLDGRVSVPKVTEVVDVARGQQSTGGERVDGRVTPLRDRLAFFA